MIHAELRVCAVLRSMVAEFTRLVELPFPPVAWSVLLDGPHVAEPEGHKIAEVYFDLSERRYVCRMMDDLDAAAVFGDDVEGVCVQYEGKGWKLVASGPIRRVFIGRQAG